MSGSHLRRGLAIAAVAVLVVPLLLVGLAVLLFDPNDYRARLSAAVQRKTGRPLALGRIELAVFPWLRVRVDDLALGNAAGFGPEPMLRVRRAEIGVRLWPLLRDRRVEADTVRLDGAALALAVAADGRSNWQDLLDWQRRRPPSAPLAYRVAGLDVRDAMVAWNDARNGRRALVKRLALRTSALDGAAPFDFAAAGRVLLAAPAGAGPSVTADASLAGTLVLDLPAQRYAAPRLALSVGATVSPHVAAQVAGRQPVVPPLPAVVEMGLTAAALRFDGANGALQVGPVRVQLHRLRWPRMQGSEDSTAEGDRSPAPAAATVGSAKLVTNAAAAKGGKAPNAGGTEDFQATGSLALAGMAWLRVADSGATRAGDKGVRDAAITAAAVRGLEFAATLAGPPLPAMWRQPVQVGLAASGTAVVPASTSLSETSASAPAEAVPTGRAKLAITRLAVLGLSAHGDLQVDWPVQPSNSGTAAGSAAKSTPSSPSISPSRPKAPTPSDGPVMAGTAWLADGRIELAPFDPRQLLAALGIALPPPADPSALRSARLGARLLARGGTGEFGVQDLQAQLDDTRLAGTLRYAANSPRLRFELSADTLDADRYLPAVPPTVQPAAPNPNVHAAGAASPIEQLDLTAVDAALRQLQALDAEGSLRVQRLGLRGMVARDVLLRLDGGATGGTAGATESTAEAGAVVTSARRSSSRAASRRPIASGARR